MRLGREAWRLVVAAAGVAVVAGAVALTLASPLHWPFWLATTAGLVAMGGALVARDAQLEDEVKLQRVDEQRRDALAAHERSSRDLEQFAYMASHDLKAPLRGIAHLAVWIREDLGPSMTPPASEKLTMLHRRVERMEALINSLLEYSRAGRTPRVVEVVDTRALVSETLELLAATDGTTLVSVDEQMPVVVTPRAPLQQVWMNLLSNALKHGRGEQPRIECHARDLGEEWCFSVSDNGPGIPGRYHERAFELFQTLSPRDRVESTGVGLAIVKKLVEAEGGRVWIEGEPDTGARFCFTWPKRSRTLS